MGGRGRFAFTRALFALTAPALVLAACATETDDPTGSASGSDGTTSKAVLALESCNQQAPFGAPVRSFTGSMNVNGLTFSSDGLTAYVTGPGTGGNGVFVAKRPSTTAAFGPPSAVTALTTSANQRTPALSADGLTLFLTRSLPNKMNDIVRSEWNTSTNAFDPPEPITGPLNSAQQDEDPFLLGTDRIYFVSERPDGTHRDIWTATLSGGTFDNVGKVAGVNSDYEEYHPVVTPDGLTIYFSSRRFGIGSDTDGDIFMARRNLASDSFSNVVNLASLNSTGVEFPVGISGDGCTLYFASNEETGLGSGQDFRLYEATRGTSPTAQVSLTLNIIGTGSVTTPPFNCSTGNVGTCSAPAAPGMTMVVWANTQAMWTGSCTGNGSQPSTDGVITFAQNAVCTVRFPNSGPVGTGGLCSLSMDCQPGVECINNHCGCTNNAACDDANTCTTDTCNQGQCTHAAVANGTTCSDGTLCTRTDTCQAGVCVGSDFVYCSAGNACVGRGTCSPLTGTCWNALKPNGTPCNDNNACTTGDHCDTGLCVKSGTLACDDGNFCNGEEACNRTTGCVSSAPPDLDDGIDCTSDVCVTLGAVWHLPIDANCAPGFRCDQNLGCVDVAECEAGTDACDDNATCTNTPGGYSCTCNPGFSGDGFTCTEECTRITVNEGVERCVIKRADGTVDLFLDPDNVDPNNPWKESFNQDDEPDDNYCGPTALKNLMAWYGINRSYAALADGLNTNTWDTTRVLAAAVLPCGASCVGVPTCIAGCELAAGVAADAIIKAGTLPGDMMTGMIALQSLLYQGGQHYINCIDRPIHRPDIRTSLQHGNPVMVLESTGTGNLHWVLVTGFFANQNDNGHLWVRLANGVDVRYEEFNDNYSLDKVGSGVVEWFLDEAFDISFRTTYRISQEFHYEGVLTKCP